MEKPEKIVRIIESTIKFQFQSSKPNTEIWATAYKINTNPDQDSLEIDKIEIIEIKNGKIHSCNLKDFIDTLEYFGEDLSQFYPSIRESNTWVKTRVVKKDK